MIIVKTKTGDAFINDKETLEFTFDREKSEVHIYRESNYLPHSKIEDVESVAYTSDAQQTFYQCENSIVKRQNERLEQQNEIVKRQNERIEQQNVIIKMQAATTDRCHRLSSILLREVCMIEKAVDSIFSDEDLGNNNLIIDKLKEIKTHIEDARIKAKEIKEEEKAELYPAH